MNDDSGEDATPNRRVAIDVRSVQLADYQQTVRSLLVDPLVRPSQTNRLAAVRRWEPQLRSDFEGHLRYRLEVGGTCARLIKRPTRLGVHHGATTKSGRPFDTRRYAYTCLLLASLLRAGSQILLTDLAERLRTDAGDVDQLGFDQDSYPQRTAFVDSVRWLEQTEALVLRDGSTDAAVGAEALYDVNDEVVHLLVPSLGLRDMASITERIAEPTGQGRDDRRSRRRQAVLRRLLEEPSVLYEDLDAESKSWLRRAGAYLAEDAERLTGLEVERRAEGVALIDTLGDGTDRAFPAVGSVTQLALLLADRLTSDTDGGGAPGPVRRTQNDRLATMLDRVRPSKPDVAGAPSRRGVQPTLDTVEANDVEIPAEPRGLTMEQVRAVIAELIAENPGVRRDLRDDPAAAAIAAVAELAAFDLVFISTSIVAGRTMVMVSPQPQLWRYRSVAPGQELPASGSNNGAQAKLFGEL